MKILSQIIRLHRKGLSSNEIRAGVAIEIFHVNFPMQLRVPARCCPFIFIFRSALEVKILSPGGFLSLARHRCLFSCSRRAHRNPFFLFPFSCSSHSFVFVFFSFNQVSQVSATVDRASFTSQTG